MMRKNIYNKPFMIVERFIADNFCVVCIPKYEDVYNGVIGDPQPAHPSTHFHKDQNGNHILDDIEKNESFSTTNAAAFDHTIPGRPAFLCWKVETLEPYWAVEAQNEHQLALYEYNSVSITTTKLHS